MCLLVAACGGKADDKPEPQPPYKADLPPAEESVGVGDYVTRLAAFSDAGMVISKAGDEIQDRGDSAIFSGIVIGSLGCDEGRPYFDALVQNVRAHGGRVNRHPNLDEVDTSRDAMLGFAFGMVYRYARCPEDRETIRDVWALHRGYVQELGGGRLYPGAGEDKQINGGLFWVWDKVANYVGASGDAPSASKDRFQADLIATASGIVASKQPCYPLHLNMLSMLIAYRVGSPVNSFTRFSWCSVTRGTDLPMAEWFCERQPARSWLETYSVDAGYIYRHQRCKWESPDGVGKQGPAADFLVLRALADHSIF